MPDLERLYNAIETAAETAYGGDRDGELAGDRAAAIDAYLGRNTKPAPEGRSQVVDRSVYETIQWMLPSLSRIFANGDDVVDLPPVGPEDEQGAKQEAQYLNYLVLQRNNWFETFTTAAKDALLTKAGYLYAYRDKRRQIEIERYERQTAEGLALIMQEKPEILDLKEYEDPDYTPAPMMGPDGPMMGPDGQPMMAPPAKLYDLEIRRVKEEQKFCIEVLPPERCRISDKHRAVQLSECPYFEFYDYMALSDLRAEGYKIPEDTAGGEDPLSTVEDGARDQWGERSWDDSLDVDPAMRRVLTRWVWIKHDYDEDGVAELNYCVVVGKTIVHREECNEIPVGVLCADPLPHRHVGLGPADTVKDIQEIKTAILRQGLDNLYLSNNPRTYVDPAQVNLDDLLTSRPGGVIRGRGIFGQAIAPMPVPFVFPQAMEGLEYMDQIRENRTGTNRYFTGIDQNALNKTATGIQQLSTMAAQRVEQIARHFSNGIERLFAILHAIVLKGGHQREVVKLRGTWVQVDPATWRARTDFRISVGYAAGNKDAMVSRLVMIAQFQEKAIAAGLPIVQPQNVYETMLELIKASDFSSPERFVTDPEKAPPQEAKPDPQLQIEQMKAEKDVQVKGAELQQREGESQRQLELDKYKADLDAQTRLAIEQMHAQSARETEEFRAQHGVAMKQFEGEQSMQSEEHKAQMHARMKDQENAPALHMAEQVQQLAGKLEGAIESLESALSTALTARRQIRRGKDGRAEGVDVIGPDGAVLTSQSVVRGPDGRVIGTQ